MESQMKNRKIKTPINRCTVITLFFTLIFIGWSLNSINAEIGISYVTPDTPQAQYAIDNIAGTKDSIYQLSEKKIAALIASIDKKEFGNIHSLIIIFNDEVAVEEYFQGWNRHKLHRIYSVTKSVTSSLVGIAIEQGSIEGVDLKLTEIFTEYDRLKNMNQRKASITLEHLLTMTAGYQWNELIVPYKHSNGLWNTENDAIKMYIYSSDFIKYVLDLPLSREPGTTYNYNSGCSMLLSGIIEKKTGLSAEQFAAQKLFQPLGITKWQWTTSPNGKTDTGGGLFMFPVDMAIFGYLYLNNGIFNGKQIVPENWVNRSTARLVEKPNGEYGYQWRMAEKRSSGSLYDEIINSTYLALGFGDRTIFVLPKVNMVVVSTADNYLHKGHDIFTALPKHIIPAVISKD